MQSLAVLIHSVNLDKEISNFPTENACVFLSLTICQCWHYRRRKIQRDCVFHRERERKWWAVFGLKMCVFWKMENDFFIRKMKTAASWGMQIKENEIQLTSVTFVIISLKSIIKIDGKRYISFWIDLNKMNEMNTSNGQKKKDLSN